MKLLLTTLLVLCCCGCAGCKDCNQVNNPVSKDYPCGTRAHACSVQPLMCCWNNEVCGGAVGTGCPAGMCCYVGEGFSASPSAKPDKQQSQWAPDQ